MEQTILDPKVPTEVKYYGYNWVDSLNGDTILSSTWDVPSGITGGVEAIESTVTFILLSGGTAGASYTLINTIITSGGETLVAAIQVIVLTAAQAAGIAA